MPPLLEIEHLEKSFRRVRILNDVSLALTAGRNLLLMGPSGGGKSTLLRLVAGLDTPDGGSIRLEGRLASQTDRAVVAPHQRNIGMLFQDLGLWPNLTAEQNVQLGLARLRLSRRDSLKQARACLERCEIAGKARELPFRLSAGEQQRVALARALAPRPALLLLDEPFNGLDLVLKHALIEQLRQLSRDAGTTMLLVSHDPHDSFLLSAELAVLEEGCICESGSLENLRREPRSTTLQTWVSRTTVGELADGGD